MTVLDTVERETAVLASPLGVSVWVVRGALALGALLIFGFAVWWIFIHPGQLADAAARAKGGRIIAEGQAAAATDAQHTVVEHYNHDAVTVTLQQKGSANVQAAAGSRDPFPAPVGDAARRAICMYEAASRDPACVELHDAGPGGMADRDTLGTAPAR